MAGEQACVTFGWAGRAWCQHERPDCVQEAIPARLNRPNRHERYSALSAIHDLGVGLAVDDFGTGYSSLLYLRHFPVSALKLDRFFVAGIDHDPQDAAIARAVIDLAHSLALTAVAEGVETLGQLRALQEMGCDVAQGYYWSAAVPSASVERVLAGQGGWGAACSGEDTTFETAPPIDAAPNNPATSRASVLLVDDSDGERSLLYNHLEASGWFRVVGGAPDGQTGVELAAQTKPDLVLLDMAMPGMDGLETLLQLLRASPTTRVAIFSGFVSSGLRSQALAGGAVAVLEKGAPYSFIVEQLRLLASAPAPNPSSPCA